MRCVVRTWPDALPLFRVIDTSAVEGAFLNDDIPVLGKSPKWPAKQPACISELAVITRGCEPIGDLCLFDIQLSNNLAS
jgi:hypothetical protein